MTSIADLKITRSAVVHNAATDDAPNTIAYSMSRLDEDGYRKDCSGQVCKWFRIPPSYGESWGGLNTVSMVTSGLFVPIEGGDLKPGDVVGKMGPGTDGANGHVRLFDRWFNDDDNDNRYWCYEVGADSLGPDHLVHDDLADAGHGVYQAYRFVAIVDDSDATGATYTIVSGDTLAEIAERFDWEWIALYRHNESTIEDAAHSHGMDSSHGGNLIYPGTVLDITHPDGLLPAPRTYEIVSGDTLGDIAGRFGTTAQVLYNLNATTLEQAARAHGKPTSRGGDRIWPGTVLTLP